MKKLILFLFVFFCITNVYAQNVFGRLSTSAYFYETHPDVSISSVNVRSFNILSLTATKDKFSLKTRMNFEADFSENYKDDPRLRFYNFYLEGKNLFNLVTVRLGRQTLINSLGASFDGVSLKFKKKKYTLTTYYGGNVPAYQKFELTDDLADNYVLGAKFNTEIYKNLNLGLDYINKHFKPDEYYAERLDENYNPVNTLIQKNSSQYHYLSLNARYFKKDNFRLSSKFVYDLNFKQASRFNFSGRIQATKKLGVNLYYNYREARIAYNSIFSVFNFGNSQEIETGLDYKFGKQLSITGKYGYVKYKDENSSRLSLNLHTIYGTLNYRKTFGFAGELDAVSIYTAKTLFNGKLTPSIGVSYTEYKISEDDETDNLISLTGGINYRPAKKLSFDFQTQYYNNKYYKNDLRFLLRANYYFRIN